MEAEIASAEALVIELETKLQDADIYRDAPRFQETLDALEAVKAKLPGLYEHWEEATELNG